MMTGERLLSQRLDATVRNVVERWLHNNVLGGGNLNGKQFSYANKHATSGKEVVTPADWFEVCCCPPNLSSTLDMLRGYTWSADVDTDSRTVILDVYLLLSAKRNIVLPGDAGEAVVEGCLTKVTASSSLPPRHDGDGRFSYPRQTMRRTLRWRTFYRIELDGESSVEITFDLPIRLLGCHPRTNQDTFTVQRGPIVYVVESFDNSAIEGIYPHFHGVGLSTQASLVEVPIIIGGI